MKLTFVSLMLFLVIGPASAQVGTKSAEADVLETVFRDQIARCYKDRDPQTYFLSYQRGDLSETLMARFGSNGPRVRLRSQMVGFKDKETGDRGILLAISNVDWLNGHSVALWGSCAAAMLDAYHYTYRVARRKGKWIVLRRKLTGVS